MTSLNYTEGKLKHQSPIRFFDHYDNLFKMVLPDSKDGDGEKKEEEDDSNDLLESIAEGLKTRTTLDQEIKKVQVVKRSLEAEEEGLTSCLKIRKVKAIQWSLGWLVLKQAFVLCWAVPEEFVQLKERLAFDLHLPVKIASSWDPVFDIKQIFKMS